MAKRRRIIEDSSGDAESSGEASQYHRDYNRESNSFEGQGIQNRGNLNIGRDVTIQNFGSQPNTNRDDDKQRVLLDSLAFEQMDDRQLSIKPAHARTCRWFLKIPAYVDWTQKNTLHNNHNFLWIRGKPGAGKSTLMKFLLRCLRNRIRRARNREVLLSFFFNARGHDLEKTTVGLYRSLLLQLLEARPDLQYVLDNIRVGHHWTIESLKSIFGEALQALDDTSVVCLVIDALDECNDTQIRDMVLFFSDLAMNVNQLHICFASRHYPHITVETGLSVVLEKQPGHDDDIASYLSSALRIGHNNLAEQIRSNLQEKSSGVFMWVVLVVDILNEEYDAGRTHILLERIKQLPEGLHDLFANILTRDRKNMHSVLLCIQWVLFAQQPLTPKQLYFAILSGSEPGNLAGCHRVVIYEDDIKRYILHNSKGLAESTKSESPTIQFIHESVRDFLLKNDGLSRIWPHLSTNLPGQSHDVLKQCCLTYMNMEALASLEELSNKGTTRFPLLEYANRGILYHAEQAQNDGISQQDFLATLFPRSIWVKHHNVLEKKNIRQYTANVSLLYILAEAGTPALIHAHSSRQSCFEVEKERYGLPILAAYVTKRSDAVQAMLELEAKRLPEFPFSDFCRQWPQGLDTVCNSSRNFTFDIRRLPYYIINFGNEQLSFFFFMAEERGVHIEAKEKTTALSYAAQNGYSMLAKLLIDRGADASAVGIGGNTPLHMASRGGHIEVAMLLLNHGADVLIMNYQGWAPIHFAAHADDSYTITKLLIDHGGDISAVDNCGMTPMHRVSGLGTRQTDKTAKLLIDHGADMSTANSGGRTPLHEALIYQANEIAKLLINHGADILATNYNGETPLHMALSHPNKETTEIAKLLIDHGASISAVDNRGRTPLHTALADPNKETNEIAKLLIDYGADISAVDSSGRTPLHTALSIQTKELAEIIFVCDDNLGVTSYVVVSAYSRNEIAKILIDHNADVSAVDNSGQTPLHGAATWSKEIVQLLIDHNADISAVDNDGQTPLHKAAAYGKEEVVKLLFSHGADISAIDNDGRKPEASETYNKDKMTKLLSDLRGC